MFDPNLAYDEAAARGEQVMADKLVEQSLFGGFATIDVYPFERGGKIALRDKIDVKWDDFVFAIKNVAVAYVCRDYALVAFLF